MKKTFEHLTDLEQWVGQSLGQSEWIAIDQQRIDHFADATDDQQWIHTDPQRAAKGPFGATVAHGFLTLSLLPAFFDTAYEIADTRLGVNYGLNRVRFPAPAPVGCRLRAHFKLLAYEAVEGGAQLTVEATIEREGAAKPVCVAESVVRRYV